MWELDVDSCTLSDAERERAGTRLRKAIARLGGRFAHIPPQQSDQLIMMILRAVEEGGKTHSERT